MMTTVFLIAATILFCTLSFVISLQVLAWNGKDFPNLLIKVLLAIMTVAGIYLIVHGG